MKFFLVATVGVGWWLSTHIAVASEDSFQNALNPSSLYSCGPNSLFMFMILTGHQEVSRDNVAAQITLSPQWGSSLLDLRNAAKNFGVNTEMRRYRIEDIDSVPLPAIVHISMPNVPEQVPNHFDVLYKVDADWIYLIHGITAEVYHVRRYKLSQWWTGYALVPKTDLVGGGWWRIVAAALLAANVITLVYYARRFSPLSSVDGARDFGVSA